MEAPQRREGSVSELVDALGCGQVLEAVLAEVAQPVRAEEGSRGGRDEHLSAVAARGDAGRPVDVDADVALLGDVGRAGVDAHAHADRTRAQSVQGLGGRVQRTRRCREGDEERVALGINLDAAPGADRLAEDAAMFCERFRVRVRPELVQQLGRALDIGEEEGDGSGREIAPHGLMMR